MNFRIISLVPSLTELVVSLGLRDHLVGRTGFCIHPADVVRSVPKVGGTKDVNLDRVRQLAPTHVLVNVDENRLETVQRLREFVPNVVVTHPNAPQDNLALFEQMACTFGSVAGVHGRAEALADDLQAELAATQASHFAPESVLYLIWRDPWMTVARDTYISRMLAQVNWQTWPDVAGGSHGAARYPTLKGDEAGLTQVRRVLLSSEPYRFTDAHLPAARELCPHAQALCVDGELLSWYGPRAAAGLRALRALRQAGDAVA